MYTINPQLYIEHFLLVFIRFVINSMSGLNSKSLLKSVNLLNNKKILSFP